MKPSTYTTLFLDIGGVLLSNGWDHSIRTKAAETFQLDLVEFNKRHALTFDTYEIGKITLDVYLDRTVFYVQRDFSREKFKEFMFNQSQPIPQMIELIRGLKSRYCLRTVAVSNEGRELMNHRISRFKMKEFIDFFVCSAFIGLRKPDVEIYRMALELAQVSPQEVIYIDDRLMLGEIAAGLGMQAIVHKTVEQTEKLLEKYLYGKFT